MTKIWLLILSVCVGQFPALHSHEHLDSRAVSELCQQLNTTTLEAEVLYAETSSRSAGCLHAFLRAAPMIADDVVGGIDRDLLINAPSGCRRRFEYRTRLSRSNAHVAAEYNADNHQKFFLAHMLVIRMHLNKGKLFLKRAETALKACGSPCQSAETQHHLARWHRSVVQELHRSNDDILHARLAYRDLLLHSARRLGRVRRRTAQQIAAAERELARCARP